MNSRFLILPTVEVPNLASQVLSRALGKVALDWETRYGVRPVLVETFVDPERFLGSCYQAANWTKIGKTAGGTHAHPKGKRSEGPKDLYLYPLSRDVRDVLCREPERRWGIEVFHRILKSGCAIEDRQLATTDRLEACLAIELVIAWRIQWLTVQGRETPDLPCDGFFSEEEWKPLYAYTYKRPPPKKPPTLREAIKMVAKLGGHLGRKSDGDPGPMALWRGLIELSCLAAGWAMALQFGLGARAGP